MSDNKMLQAILDGQKELKNDIGRVEKKVDNGIKKVTKRLDNLGLELAELSDDAPTVDEFDNLEKRVSSVEQRISPQEL